MFCVGSFPFHIHRLAGGERRALCHVGYFVYAMWPFFWIFRKFSGFRARGWHMRNAHSGLRKRRGGGGGGASGPRAKGARLGARSCPNARVGHGRPKEDCMAVRALHGLAFRGANRAGRFWPSRTERPKPFIGSPFRGWVSGPSSGGRDPRAPPACRPRVGEEGKEIRKSGDARPPAPGHNRP